MGTFDRREPLHVAGCSNSKAFGVAETRGILGAEGLKVGLLRQYCKHARRTQELRRLIASPRLPRPPATAAPAYNEISRTVAAEMVQAYREGASTYTLANQYNVRRNTVRDVLRRAGFDLSSNAKRAALSEEQKAEARRLFASGTTRRELVEMYGVSESTIRRVLAFGRR